MVSLGTLVERAAERAGVGDSLNDVVRFGKHQGKTYRHLVEHEERYCLYIESRESFSHHCRVFSTFLRKFLPHYFELRGPLLRGSVTTRVQSWYLPLMLKQDVLPASFAELRSATLDPPPATVETTPAALQLSLTRSASVVFGTFVDYLLRRMVHEKEATAVTEPLVADRVADLLRAQNDAPSSQQQQQHVWTLKRLMAREKQERGNDPPFSDTGDLQSVIALLERSLVAYKDVTGRPWRSVLEETWFLAAMDGVCRKREVDPSRLSEAGVPEAFFERLWSDVAERVHRLGPDKYYGVTLSAAGTSAEPDLIVGSTLIDFKCTRQPTPRADFLQLCAYKAMFDRVVAGPGGGIDRRTLPPRIDKLMVFYPLHMGSELRAAHTLDVTSWDSSTFFRKYLDPTPVVSPPPAVVRSPPSSSSSSSQQLNNNKKHKPNQRVPLLQESLCEVESPCLLGPAPPPPTNPANSSQDAPSAALTTSSFFQALQSSQKCPTCGQKW